MISIPSSKKKKTLYKLVLAFGFFLASFTSANAFYEIEVPDTDIVGQFHGDPIDNDLTLFMAGNQFVVMDLLVEAFIEENPQYPKIFYVTIPPGKLLNWILAGGTEIRAEHALDAEGFQLPIMPDVYTTVNKGHMDSLNAAGLVNKFQTYAHNRLVFMVLSTDPLAGQTLSPTDMYNFLADPTVTLSEPDIITQGIERHFWQMYTDMSKVVFPADPAIQALVPNMFNPANLASDPLNSLRRIVYHDKVMSGATTITSIHHLETPAALRAGTARAGAVWITEVNYQQDRLGLTDVDRVEVGGLDPSGAPLNRSTKVNYLAAEVGSKGKAERRQAAQAWLYFLTSPRAQAILEGVGFIGASDDELANPFVYPSASGDDNDDD